MNKANKIAALSLVFMALGVAAVLLMVGTSTTTKARLFVDNGTDKALMVTLEGQPPMRLAAHSAAEVSLPVGGQKVVALDDQGKVVDEQSFELPAAEGITDRSWVYNVKGKNAYTVYELSYGEAETKEPYSIGEKSAIYQLPLGATWFLPAQRVPEKGQAGTVVRLVGYMEIHRGSPCCENLQGLLDAPEK